MEEVRLNKPWTAEVVGRMHRYRISNTTLAERCDVVSPGGRPGYAPTYLSTVLNGKVFESEEAEEKTKNVIFDALERIEAEINEQLAKQEAESPAENEN